MIKFYKNIFALSFIYSLAFYPNFSKGQIKGQVKPNVIIILTDDMGYGEISCYNKNQKDTFKKVPIFFKFNAFKTTIK